MIITEAGRPRRVPRYVALQLIQWAKALKGDHKAFMAIHQSMRDAGLLRAEVEVAPPVISQDDQLIIEDYLTRIGITSPGEGGDGTRGRKRSPRNLTKKEPRP
jgi:hypothetical protein